MNAANEPKKRSVYLTLGILDRDREIMNAKLSMARRQGSRGLASVYERRLKDLSEIKRRLERSLPPVELRSCHDVETRLSPAGAGTRAKPTIVRNASSSEPQVAGYAAVFFRANDPGTEFMLWDDVVERIAPTAFDECLLRGDDVRGLVNHDKGQIFGRRSARNLTLTTDKVGLRYVATPPDTQVGRDLLTNIRCGLITGSSFSFMPTDLRWFDEGNVMVRELLSMDLYDVGPVTFPAYESTSSEVVEPGGGGRGRQRQGQRHQDQQLSLPDRIKVRLRLAELLELQG